jgi:hypothetical protein
VWTVRRTARWSIWWFRSTWSDSVCPISGSHRFPLTPHEWVVFLFTVQPGTDVPVVLVPTQSPVPQKRGVGGGRLVPAACGWGPVLVRLPPHAAATKLCAGRASGRG